MVNNKSICSIFSLLFAVFILVMQRVCQNDVLVLKTWTKNFLSLNWSPAPISLLLCTPQRNNRFVYFLKWLKWSFYKSGKGFCAIKPERLCSVTFLGGLDAPSTTSTPKDTFVEFWRSELKRSRSACPCVSLSFEDKTTRTLWGIFFAQMSSLIQRWTGPHLKGKGHGPSGLMFGPQERLKVLLFECKRQPSNEVLRFKSQVSFLLLFLLIFSKHPLRGKNKVI